MHSVEKNRNNRIIKLVKDEINIMGIMDEIIMLVKTPCLVLKISGKNDEKD